MHSVAVDVVARLPPEILTLVFSILSSIARPHRTQSTPTKFTYNLGWLTVTHVCRRWRNVSLRDPVLWASDVALPSALGHVWTAAYLSRAQDVPLTVTYCYDCIPEHRGPLPADTAFIVANLARMGAILDLRTCPQCLRALCGTSASLLQTLRLCFISRTGQFPFLPDGLLGGAEGLPQLRHLSVVTLDVISLTPLLLQQLVSFDITLIRVYMPSSVLASMFAALGKMPALERLALELAPEDTDGMPITLLPTLQQLSLATDVPSARRLLARLALPAGVRVLFSRKRDFTFTDELPTVFPAMNACVDSRAAPIVRVDVQADKVHPELEHNVKVDAWRSGDTDGAPALAIRFTGWKHVPGVLRSLASTHLEVLAVAGDALDAAWLDALGSAPWLRHVTVKGGAVPPFCAGLLERALGALPALATLVINVHGYFLADTVLGDTLPRCLAARGNAGNILSELEVVGYGEDLDDTCVRALREAVPGLVVRRR
ncbi:hypothetical protein FA95DRAFT_1607093 [Auriscalpium vulgare]|uniref:Uncharacterized protein n=1 Tax=Auriscalpium vulgare TaxID=40419 RepID=A0ACB8RQE2_9AGAM|nr:hypothetical protein FA95DRAFT_1607093 [Auriscalpium vulgare]